MWVVVEYGLVVLMGINLILCEIKINIESKYLNEGKDIKIVF